MKRPPEKTATPKMNFLYTAIMLTMTISWFISMIRSSILLAQDQSSDFTLIATIVTSAILFSICLPITILFYLSSSGKHLDKVSVLLPPNAVRAMNKWIERTFEAGSPTENAIIVVGFLTLAALVGQATSGLNPSLFPVALVVGLVLHSIDQREKKKRMLIAMLKQDERIPLKVATKRLDLNSKNLIRMAIDLAAEGYPVAVDHDSKFVYRTGNMEPSQRSDPQTIEYPVQLDAQSTGESCAYCGEINPIIGAKFCIKCGASMVPAK